MAARNPLAKVTDAAHGALSLPLKATEKAVGVAAGGIRVAASLVYSTAERAKSLVGIEDERDAPAPTDAPVDVGARSNSSASAGSAAPGPVTVPPAQPLGSVEALAEAAVAREMAEEPLPSSTPSKAARTLSTTKTAKPDKVVFTSTGGGSEAAAPNDAESVDEPLIDPATAKALKSESDILRAAADVDQDL